MDKKQFATITKEEDGNIKLLITIPSEKVQKAWEEEVKKVVENAEISGFRKGKAPKNIVEQRLDKTKVQEEVLRKLLPDAYIASVSEHNLKPIINPKIHVQKLEEGKDWTFEAITCETPNVTLNGYKEAVKKVTAKAKIVIPGKQQEGASLDEIAKALLESITVSIPGVLIEGEVERLLSQLLDEIKRLGLTLDQYLASTNKTVEQLKNEYEQKARNDIAFEFALQAIAQEEKITVEQKEIDEALQSAKDQNERKQLESNGYLLANILRQQKTLDFLKNL